MNGKDLKKTFQFQGTRRTQEDRWSSGEILPGVYWHACYDGHGGHIVADKAMKVLPQMLSRHLKKYFESDNVDQDDEVIQYHIVDAFLETDKAIANDPDVGYRGDFCGSTVSGILLFSQKLYLVNLGDSKSCIMSDKQGILTATASHKPDSKLEKSRIYAAGGRVTGGAGGDGFFYSSGIARVNGMLAVSRSFGDWDMELDDSTIVGNGVMTFRYPEVCQSKELKGRNAAIISKIPTITKFVVPQTNDALLGLICTDGLTDITTLPNLFLRLSDDAQKGPHDDWAYDAFESYLHSLHKLDNTTVLLLPL